MQNTFDSARARASDSPAPTLTDDRQTRQTNDRRNCSHCAPLLETVAHMFADCDRFRNHYRQRHYDSGSITLACLATALLTALADIASTASASLAPSRTSQIRRRFSGPTRSPVTSQYTMRRDASMTQPIDRPTDLAMTPPCYLALLGSTGARFEVPLLVGVVDMDPRSVLWLLAPGCRNSNNQTAFRNSGLY